MLAINLLGSPISWRRPCHKLTGGRVIIFDSQKKEKDQIRWQIRGHLGIKDLLTCPVTMTMTFAFNPPIASSRVRRREYLSGMSNHMIKPDIDNLAKFYLDCLTGCVLKDDCQVFSLVLNKVYSEVEGTKITINPVHALVGNSSGAVKDLADSGLEC
jgi:Holliday junction resolvase RusA-like endonuclease